MMELYVREQVYLLKRVLRLVGSIIFYCLLRANDFLLFFQGKPRRKTFIVLCYHAIASGKRVKFARQMDILRKTCVPVVLEPETFSEGANHFVAVTFDDGFNSIFDNAIDILRERNIPSTMFVPSGYLGKKQGWIKNSSNDGFNEEIVSSLYLKELDSNLVTIGSHGVSHRDLGLIDCLAAKQEVMDSKNDLEKQCGREIKYMSFPYDGFNKVIVQWARQCGFRKVYSGYGTCLADNEDCFLVGRIDVSPDDFILEFRLKLVGAYNWLHVAVNLKHKFLQKKDR